MRGWPPSRWPLRTRVALAFLAATAIAVTGLGVLVQLRVSDALEDRLRDSVGAEADRLESGSGRDRLEAVSALGGEVHAQILTERGDVRASSRLVADPLLDAAELRGSGRSGWLERTVTVLDDDAAAAGKPDPEQERLVLLVKPVEEGFLVVGTSREDADEALATLRNQLLIAGPLALAVAGGLGYVVAGAGLRPIERMRARAATISARSAGERLPVPEADDELRRLALTLNAMIGRLDDGLQRERRFVADASHDLRTPLALMRTEVELALAGQRTPEELRQALHSVDDEVCRLIALAEDLLDRAGSGDPSLPIDSRPVDLVDLAARVVERFKASADPRDIALTAPRPVEIRGDATHLDRALSNLVDNAIRHGAGDIEVAVSAAPGTAAITVSDEGDGFPMDISSRSGDSGLGLRIVREIARAHGGSVDVDRIGDRTRVRLVLASPQDH
ncbi:ATP-binding protein [Nocardioides sp. NBC_00850]|uniref:ATP-binding protein n=1 Tax=Nocardioides sp. NBC_00850 TaxID=2976001 RepID=UPI00386C8950|nr:ATP-binding protein [Nocardioides sp. NBC_00850]